MFHLLAVVEGPLLNFEPAQQAGTNQCNLQASGRGYSISPKPAAISGIISRSDRRMDIVDMLILFPNSSLNLQLL